MSPEVEEEATEEPHSETLEERVAKLRESLCTSVDFASLKKYKRTDFRRELLLKQLKDLQRFSRLSKQCVSVKIGPQPRNASAITVDTTRAGSNIDVVRLCLKELNWREFPTGKPKGGFCDLVWNSASFYENPNVHTNAVNKFPGINILLHKINLSRTLEMMRQLFPKDYDFYPQTWYLPHQLTDFTAAVKERQRSGNRSRRTDPNQKPTYIVKPDEGSQGDGIYLIREPEEYRVGSKNHVVQEYLVNPLLIEGYKFDLRVYVLVKSIDPLEIYLCKEGMARFCTQPYSRPNQRNLSEVYMHLTNYSLNKHSKNFVVTDREDNGSKRTLTSVFHLLEGRGYDLATLWHNIEELICKTAVAFVPELKVYLHAETVNPGGGPSCFHILGFDVLILDTLKPMLLEVNCNPSMRLDSEVELVPGIPEFFVSQVDVLIKKPLVRDTLKLMYPQLRAHRRRALRLARPSIDVAQDLDSDDDEEDEEDEEEEMEKEKEGEKQEEKEMKEAKKEEKKDQKEERKEEKKEIKEEKKEEKKEEEKEKKRKSSDRRPKEPLSERQRPSEAAEGERRREKAGKENAAHPRLAHLRREPPLEVSHRGDVVCVVSGTSPRIRHSERRKERQLRRHMQRQRSWIRSVHKDSSSNARRSSRRRRSSSIYSEEDGCLDQIYPSKFKEELEHLRVLEEITELFISSVGVRSNFRIGATAFRTFTRRCQLSQLGFSSAAIDILFIDVQRRWEYIFNDSGSGLSYQAFLEAFFRICFQKYPQLDRLEAVARLMRHCKVHLGLASPSETETLLSRRPKRAAEHITDLKDYLKKSEHRRQSHYVASRSDWRPEPRRSVLPMLNSSGAPVRKPQQQS